MSTVLGLLERHAGEQRALSSEESKAMAALISEREGAEKALADMAAQEREATAQLERLRTEMVSATRYHDRVKREITVRQMAARTAAEAAHALENLAARHRREMVTLVATAPPGVTAPQPVAQPETGRFAVAPSVNGNTPAPAPAAAEQVSGAHPIAERYGDHAEHELDLSQVPQGPHATPAELTEIVNRVGTLPPASPVPGAWPGPAEEGAPLAEGPPLVDPDCRADKHSSCVGGVCECTCHQADPEPEPDAQAEPRIPTPDEQEAGDQ